MSYLERKQFVENLKLSLWIVGFMWAVRIIDILLPIDLNQFGILPRTIVGIIGIFASPFLHSGLSHLISNTVPLVILLMVVLSTCRKVAFFAIAFISISGGSLVWLLARGESYHIGASGLIYGLIAFLIANGIFRKDKKSMLIALLTFMVYGGLIWGVFPYVYRPHISWEGHLFGAISGAYTSYYYKNRVI